MTKQEAKRKARALAMSTGYAYVVMREDIGYSVWSYMGWVNSCAEQYVCLYGADGRISED